MNIDPKATEYDTKYNGRSIHYDPETLMSDYFINYEIKDLILSFLINGYLADKELEEAAEQSDFERIKKAMEKGASDIKYSLELMCERIDEKVYPEQCQILNYFFDKGLLLANDVFLTACFSGFSKMVHFLMKKGANDWNKGLIGASQNGDIELGKKMLQLGATDLEAALYFSFHYNWDSDNENMISFMIQKGAKNSKEYLRYYCSSENLKKTELILKNAKVSRDLLNSCLLIVVEKNNLKLCRLLLEYGANPSIRDKHHNPILIPIILEGHVAMAKMLIDFGADLRACCRNGFNAFHAACTNGIVDMIPFLLNKGMDINGVDSEGKTALCWAAYTNHDNVCKILVKNGADMTIGDPLGAAFGNNHTEAFDFLTQAMVEKRKMGSSVR